MIDLGFNMMALCSMLSAWLFSAALRWTPLFLVAILAARVLRGSARDCRLLWLSALVALPLLPVVSALAPELPMPDWRNASVLEVEDEGVVAMPPTPSSTVPRESKQVSGTAVSFGAAELLGGLWLIGVLGLVWREVTRHVGSWALIRGSSPASGLLREQALEAARDLGVPAHEVGLADVSVPMLVGLIKPRILLPPAAVGWPVERRRAALLHELAHARHGDPWADATSRLVVTLFWFHPGAWWAHLKLREEMELMADASAVDQGLETESYGLALLDIARGARHPLQGLAMARPGGLERRLRALVEQPPRAALVVRGAVTVSLGLLACVTAATVMPSLDPWLEQNKAGWGLRCGDDLGCREIQGQAESLLAETGKSGVVLVQNVETGELMAYSVRGPAPVPLVPPASVAKLTLATLWWEAGLGNGQVECLRRWQGKQGLTLQSVRDQGVLEIPRQMLVTSCTTAAGVMAERLLEEEGQAVVRKRLAALGFADGIESPWLPAGVPAPSLVVSEEWEERLPEIAIMIGRMATTPFHLASLLQAVGDDGLRRPTGFPSAPSSRSERIMSAQTAALMRGALGEVITEGTGRKALGVLADSPWKLLGKTGTLKREDGGYDGWFGGLAADDGGKARFVIVVFVDGGGFGGSTATVLAAEMTRFLGQRPRN